MILIGLNGRLRSGKDTLFEIVRDDEQGVQVERAGFADALKLSGIRALGYEPRDVNHAIEIANLIKDSGTIQVHLRRDGSSEAPPSSSVHSITGRQFWQWYGTEAHRRIFGDDFWVDALLPQATTFGNGRALAKRFQTDVLFITDTRFENEALRILQLGGEVWRIDADERLGPLPGNVHPSEHKLSRELITREVDNNGTLEQFERAVLNVAEKAIKPWFYGS